MTTAVAPRWNRTDPDVYTAIVERAVRTGHWVKLNTFGNPKSAQTIVWMIENGKGLRAFKAYVPGSFKASIRNEREVWFKVDG